MCVENDGLGEKRRDGGFYKRGNKGKGFSLRSDAILTTVRFTSFFYGSAIVTQLSPPLDLFQL